MSIDFLNLSYNEICSLTNELGEPSYRGEQLYIWLHKGVTINEMTNLPKAFREKLCVLGYAKLPSIKKKLVSEIDGTVKYLFELTDGQLIESVVMKYKYGNTICVSSQAGCRMGCRFCASTLKGLSRNLEPSEILGQVIAAQKDTGERISNIVIMGIGEPLDNYDNVIKFLQLVNSEKGLNIGYRHISLSTCGLADKIRRLAEENLPITLSLSLHSVSDKERSEIMPVTNKWSVEDTLYACRDYFLKTGRRISFEYTLISGKNDSPEHAARLAAKLKQCLGRDIPVHVNLIPLNEVSERSFRRSGSGTVKEFERLLLEQGVNATVRRHLGSDINASCGQLRYNNAENSEKS